MCYRHKALLNFPHQKSTGSDNTEPHFFKYLLIILLKLFILFFTPVQFMEISFSSSGPKGYRPHGLK